MVPLNLFSTLLNESSEPFNWRSDVGRSYISAIEDCVRKLCDIDHIKFLVGDPIFDSAMEFAVKTHDSKTLYGNLNWFLSELECNPGMPLYTDRVLYNNRDVYIRYTFISTVRPTVISWVRNLNDRLWIEVHSAELPEGLELNVLRSGIIIKD